jgi:hypothetical protein
MPLYDNNQTPDDDIFGGEFFEGMTNPEEGRNYVDKAGDHPARLMSCKTGTTAKGAKFANLLWLTDDGKYVGHKIYTRSADPLKDRALGQKAAVVIAEYNWTPEMFKSIVKSGKVPLLDAIISVKVESNFGGKDYAEVVRVRPVSIQPPMTVASVISASGSASDDGLPY